MPRWPDAKTRPILGCLPWLMGFTALGLILISPAIWAFIEKESGLVAINRAGVISLAIHKSAQDMGRPNPLGMPREGMTSAEYLTRLVLDGYLEADRSFFGPVRLRPRPSRPITLDDPIRSEDNIWRLVAGLDPKSAPQWTPIVMSRNLVQATLGDPPYVSEERLQGLRHSVVVGAVGGGSLSIPVELLGSNLPDQLGGEPVGNPILPP